MLCVMLSSPTHPATVVTRKSKGFGSEPNPLKTFSNSQRVVRQMTQIHLTLEKAQRIVNRAPFRPSCTNRFITCHRRRISASKLTLKFKHRILEQALLQVSFSPSLILKGPTTHQSAPSPVKPFTGAEHSYAVRHTV